MNREIKFRVWDNKWHHWVGEFEAKSLNNPEYSITQFTGLKDKNGKEIFEGDILAQEYYIDEEFIGGETYIHKSKVCFHNGYFYNDEDNKFSLILAAEKGQNGHVEVIGNIFENPNLLP